MCFISSGEGSAVVNKLRPVNKPRSRSAGTWREGGKLSRRLTGGQNNRCAHTNEMRGQHETQQRNPIRTFERNGQIEIKKKQRRKSIYFPRLRGKVRRGRREGWSTSLSARRSDFKSWETPVGEEESDHQKRKVPNRT